ncbi:MAG: helix-turn-helix transcriptional regulator [Methylotenera sp.]|jgi:DNA-binding NarL/FixJ family response regulator|nr:helix-turn-helix transcriptional regulator [Methylotenera sp.]
MNDLFKLPGYGYDPSLELVVTAPLFLKLKRAASMNGLSVENFMSQSAEREADRLLMLDELARQRQQTTTVAPKTGAQRPLSKREAEVLTLLSRGCTSSEVAGMLRIQSVTVNDHIKSIYRKLGVNNRAGAVVLASKIGLGP